MSAGKREIILKREWDSNLEVGWKIIGDGGMTNGADKKRGHREMASLT